MGLKVAVANGNWSSTSTWSGGVLPTVGDVVASNGFTVTIDQNINVDSITNAVQSIVTATAAMTGYSTPTGYLVEASNYQEPAWQAFDRNGSSRGYVQNLPLWISYTFPSTTAINSYRLDMYSDNYYAMKDFTFQGWNGSSWVVLHTVTGNTLTTYISPSIGNTTAYIKYRFYCTASVGGGGVIYQEISLYQLGYESTAVAGGTFNLNSGVTVTCTTSGNIGGSSSTLITYSGSGTSTINANFIAGNNLSPLVFNGTGTLNVMGNVFISGITDGLATITHSNTGTLNFTGNITTNARSGCRGILVSGAGTMNYTGNVFSGSSDTGALGIYILGIGAIVNLTGNLIWQQSPSTSYANYLVYIASAATFNMIGTVNGAFANGIRSDGNSYIKVIGPLIAGSGFGGLGGNAAVYSTSSSAINIFTGPFISSNTGIQPIYVARMHWLRTLGSYFEFRNNSTNGALPPAPQAPATRLLSPDTVSDSPIPANVRQGTSYALGSQTGTMIVPNPANVVKNVPVDNTVGTGVLDPSALWNVPLSAINTTNSIGQRVKNAATVESTGAQIQTTLNNNP